MSEASRRIPFNAPTLLGRERDYVLEVLEGSETQAGNGPFTARAQAMLEEALSHGGARPRVLLTTSATAALEMSALLAGIGPGDEVVMPAFTFSSTANAFALRGAAPVFAEVREDTLNLDEAALERALSPRTRAVCVVHYAGVGCEMEPILAFAARHGLAVIEDAAQALYATHRGRPLGAFGAMAALSFHETKNIACGEGGALVVNDPDLAERAEIAWEKGTDRVRFRRGEVDKYRWVALGSSFLPGEMTAAFLLGQLEEGRAATARRLALWNRYHDLLSETEAEGLLRRPRPPAHAGHNGHVYFVLAPSAAARERWLAGLRAEGVGALSHYVPLHDGPAGRRHGRVAGPPGAPDRLPLTEDLAARLIRLPMHPRLDEADQRRVVEALRRVALSRA